MKSYFFTQAIRTCWICGSVDKLSGEHKIKRSHFKREDVPEPAFFKTEDCGSRKIQSVNSQLLKFPASICQKCNSERTQRADRAYDTFIDTHFDNIRNSLQKITTAKNGFPDQEVVLHEDPELARYFAKHLGCALKYQKFPIPKRLSWFVLGKRSRKCVSVYVRVSPLTYQSPNVELLTLTQLGAAILSLRQSKLELPEQFQTAYMIEGLQFIVTMPLNLPEAIEFKLRFSAAFTKPGPLNSYEDQASYGIAMKNDEL